MVRSTTEVLKVVNSQNHNKPGTCQLFVRTMYDAPSVGDVDKDGDADAVDGWKSEPAKAKHNSRNVPAGLPVAFSGGSKGYGHRAISLGGDKVRSTDFKDGKYSAGNVGNGTIAELERAMNITYLGYSDTISGLEIPQPSAEPAPPGVGTGGGEPSVSVVRQPWRVNTARKMLESEHRHTKRGAAYKAYVKKAVHAVRDIPALM